MFNDRGILTVTSARAGEARELASSRPYPEPISLLLVLIGGLAASGVWSVVAPTLSAVFSALVQTGIPTRLVLLALFFGCGFALVALRTAKQIWYGYVAAIVAVAAAWNLLGMLAVQVQSVDVLALAAAGYMLVRGLVDIQEGDASQGIRR